MTEKTIRAEYPPTRIGERVLALVRAVTMLAPKQIGPAISHDRWIPLSTPGLAEGYGGQPIYVFSASCVYRGAETGMVLLIITEEQMRQAVPPFQQCFVSFLDCREEPPPTLNPLALFDYEVRRRFVRQPMWTVEPAGQIAEEAISAMVEAWNAVGAGHAPAFEWVSGGPARMPAPQLGADPGHKDDPQDTGEMASIPNGMTFRAPRSS